MKYSFITCLIFITFLGCQDLVVEEHIVGKYYITATDTEQQQQLSYAIGNGSYIGLVPGYVYSVAYNAKYIVVKQRPHFNVKQVVDYYVLERQDVEADQLKITLEPPIMEDVFNSNRSKFEAYGELSFDDL